jgi:hypothetical protein
MTRPILRSMVIIALVALAAASASADDAQVIILDQSMQNAILPVLKEYKPTASQVTISSSQQSKNLTFTSQTALSVLDNGLWAGVGGAVFTGSNARGAGGRRTLDLCGLVPLLSAGQSSSDEDRQTIVPIGKIFMPFGFAITRNTGLTVRVVGFSASTPNLCAPIPGSEFSFHIEADQTLFGSGLSGKPVRSLSDFDCKTAGGIVTANQIQAVFPGDGLQVTCNISSSSATSKAKSKNDYVFLLAIGRYFAVSQVTDAGSAGDATSIRYEKLDYVR